MKNDVFISYEHGSKSIADSIVSVLEQDKIRCWYAPRDVIGDYATSIVEAIENTSVFLLILNGEASNSPHVLNEVEMAYKKNIEHNQSLSIVPFKVSDDQFSRAMEYYIKRIHWIDATNSTLESAIEDLKVKIKKVLGIEEVSQKIKEVEERKSNKYFDIEDKHELKRLNTQQEILRKFDSHVYSNIATQYDGITVLDVGCNCGDLFVDRFSKFKNLQKAIGVEWNKDAVKKAREQYQSDIFAFYEGDVESSDFYDKLSEICQKEGVKNFNVIQISMLILHLQKPYNMLRTVRKFLAPDGILIIRDIDDGYNLAYPDSKRLFEKTIEICAKNRYSGYRKSGREIYTMLKDCGFSHVKLEKIGITTADMNFEEREAMFDTYFSFIKSDYDILIKKYPESKQIKEDFEWLEDNYEELEQEFMRDNFFFSLGFMLFTAKR